MVEPEEDELIPCIITGVREDGTVEAEVIGVSPEAPQQKENKPAHVDLVEDKELEFTTPPPLPTIDAQKQSEADRKASAGYNHTPGLRHTFKFDSVTYDVQTNGAWKRITARPHLGNRNMKNKGVARRARRGVV